MKLITQDYLRRYFCLTFLLLIISAGCVSQEQTIPTATLRVQAIKISSTNTLIPVDTITAQQTTVPYLNPLPTIALTETAKPRPSLTITPYPILTQKEALEFVEKSFMSNTGCVLPCWWSLIPGKTGSLTAQNLLLQLSGISDYMNIDENNSFIALEYPLSNENQISIGLYYTVNEDQKSVETMLITLDPLHKIDGGYVHEYENPEFKDIVGAYLLPQLLMTYGEPKEILLQGWPYNDDREPHFALILVYPEKGIFVRYEGNAITRKTGQMKICPSQSSPELILWEPGTDSGKALIESNKLKWDAPEFRPIQDVTEMDVNTFYETMLNPEACFETPLSLWDNRDFGATSTPMP